jgi:hypothetical protein
LIYSKFEENTHTYKLYEEGTDCFIQKSVPSVSLSVNFSKEDLPNALSRAASHALDESFLDLKVEH